MSVIFMAMYVYSIIGMELFHPQFATKHESHYFDGYTDFGSIGNSLLLIFQILTEQR